MERKGNEFKGWAAGRSYRNLARWFGFTDDFYRKAAGDLRITDGMRALDLGCGPGSLSFALAEDASRGAVIIGVDISEDQLVYARAECGRFDCELGFVNGSMDELPFPDGFFDVVVSSMALHEATPAVRRGAVAEVARVLRTGGVFVLVDWSKPKLGGWGVFWFPVVCWGEWNRDNWRNVYPDLCRRNGLELQGDVYVNSIVRRQVFGKG